MALSLIKSNDLFVMVASLLGHSDMTIAKYAHQVLTNVAKLETGLSLLFTSQVLGCFRQVMAQNDVNKFRVYDVRHYLLHASHIYKKKTNLATSKNLKSKLLS